MLFKLGNLCISNAGHKNISLKENWRGKFYDYRSMPLFGHKYVVMIVFKLTSSNGVDAFVSLRPLCPEIGTIQVYWHWYLGRELLNGLLENNGPKR